MASILLKEKPLIIFDGETTGVDISKDEFVQLSGMKIYPDKRVELKEFLFNPTIPIGKEASEVHGITNEQSSEFKTFKEQASEVHEFFKDSVLCGYNSDSFDVEILESQLLKNGIEFIAEETLDVMTIVEIYYSRKLTNIFKLMTGKEAVNAHNANADVQMTHEVLQKFMEMPEIGNSLESIQDYISKTNKYVDRAKKLCKNSEGLVCYAFGKSIGKPVVSDLSYARWMLSGSFTKQTKSIIEKLISE